MNLDLVKDAPLSLLVVVMVHIGLVLITLTATSDLKRPWFLYAQMLQNFAISIALSFFVGVLLESQATESFLFHNRFAITIGVLISFFVLKTFVTYSVLLRQKCADDYQAATGQNASSNETNFMTVTMGAAKVAVAMGVVAAFLIFAPSALTPFFQVFDSSSALIMYIGVGAWLAMATWPAETSVYFDALRGGCFAVADITFSNLAVTQDVENGNAFA